MTVSCPLSNLRKWVLQSWCGDRGSSRVNPEYPQHFTVSLSHILFQKSDTLTIVIRWDLLLLFYFKKLRLWETYFRYNLEINNKDSNKRYNLVTKCTDFMGLVWCILTVVNIYAITLKTRFRTFTSFQKVLLCPVPISFPYYPRNHILTFSTVSFAYS